MTRLNEHITSHKRATYPLLLHLFKPLLGGGLPVAATATKDRRRIPTTTRRRGSFGLIFLDGPFQGLNAVVFRCSSLFLVFRLGFLLPAGQSDRKWVQQIKHILLHNPSIFDSTLEFEGTPRPKVVVRGHCRHGWWPFRSWRGMSHVTSCASIYVSRACLAVPYSYVPQASRSPRLG